MPVMKTAEFTNRVAHDEASHYESPHQDLHCLSSSLLIPTFADVNFVVCFLTLKELGQPGVVSSKLLVVQIVSKQSMFLFAIF